TSRAPAWHRQIGRVARAFSDGGAGFARDGRRPQAGAYGEQAHPARGTMFERAQVRRGGRAVSFALAALAHGVLLVGAVLLVRKQAVTEPPTIVVDVRPPRGPEKPPPGKDTSSGKQTHPPRKRPPPAPRDLEHLKPPAAPEPEMEPERAAEPP